jgi:hypothetical protein
MQVLHPNPIPEDSTAGNRAGGIDGENRDRFALAANGSRQAAYQSTFARPGRTGDSDDQGAAGMGCQQVERGPSFRAAILDQTEELRPRPQIARSRALDQSDRI